MAVEIRHGLRGLGHRKGKKLQGESKSDKNDDDDTDSEDEEGILQEKEKEELDQMSHASQFPRRRDHF